MSLFEGTLYVDKIHAWFKIANIKHALPVAVYRQTDFTSKRVVVSRLHDTVGLVARFRTGVKFSPRSNNRGELTTGWLAPAWRFVAVSCKQMKSHEREPEWALYGAKVALVSCKHPLRQIQQISSPAVKYTDKMQRWKVDLEETNKQSFWRKKGKRSSEKFALDELITVFLAARIGWRKSKRAKILRYILCVFYRRESLFEM